MNKNHGWNFFGFFYVLNLKDLQIGSGYSMDLVYLYILFTIASFHIRM